MYRQPSDSPVWHLTALGRRLEFDGRKVRAGGNVEISTTFMGAFPLAPTDLDEFCWAWLAFRGHIREEWERQTPRRDIDRNKPECPGCGRIMSAREYAEQGACNDCHEGRRP